MDNKYLETIKKDENYSWLWEGDEKYYLVVSDDLDSILSAMLMMKYRKNMEIGFYINYRSGIYKKEGVPDAVNPYSENVIWVDCSNPNKSINGTGVKCISNHCISIDGDKDRLNMSDLNLNTIDNNCLDFDYFQKYNLSTFVMLLALFEHEIDNDEGLKLALCVDVGFKARYQPLSFSDRSVQEKYLVDKLKLFKLYNIQDKMTAHDFRSMMKDYKMFTKIYVNENGLYTEEDVDLELILKHLNINISLDGLKGNYKKICECRSVYTTVKSIRDKNFNNKRITSFAIVSKSNCVYSYIPITE